MPITPPNIADLTRCLTRMIRYMGLTDPDFPNSDTVYKGAPFTRNNLRDALLASDGDYCNIIISDLNHPFATIFYTEEPAELNNGDAIEAHLGTHRKVMLKVSTDPDVWKAGRQAKNYDHIQKVITFPNVYGTPKDLYLIECGLLYHTGIKGKVYSATFNIDRSAPDGALQGPEAYENGIIAGAIAMSYMNGQDLNQRQYYLAQDAMMKERAKGRETTLPDLEIFKRIGA